MNRKSLKQWVRENRMFIDDTINAVMYRYDGNGGKGTIPYPPPRYSDAERADWVRNDEGLYRCARSEGVTV